MTASKTIGITLFAAVFVHKLAVPHLLVM